jgi:hypothetical protein
VRNLGIARALSSPFRERTAAAPPAPQGAQRTVVENQQQFDRVIALVRAVTRRDLLAKGSKRSEVWEGIRRRQIGVRMRWSAADPERILEACSSGSFFALGLFLDSLRANPVVYGKMRTRGALLGRPTQFSGDPLLCEWLRGKDPEFDPKTGALVSPGHASDFQRLFPLEELGACLWDGDLGSIGLGEFVPDRTGKTRLKHLDLHWLTYDWSLHKLVYDSPWDRYVVEPGDGRWFVYAPYGIERGFAHAPWLPCALPAIAMQNAVLDRLRWQISQADPLKVIKTDKDRADPEYDALEDFAQNDWHQAAYLILRKEEEAALVESSGRGYQVFTESEKSAADAIAVTLGGQSATSGSGAGGLGNAGSAWENLESTIIQESAEKLAEAATDQGLRPYAAARGRAPHVFVKWDCRTGQQKTAQVDMMTKAAEGLTKMSEALSPFGKTVDLEAYLDDLGVSVQMVDLPKKASPTGVELEIAPTSLDAVIDANEVRDNKGLPPWPAGKGDKSIAELKDGLQDTADTAAPPAATASAVDQEIPIHETRTVAGLPIVIEQPRGSVQSGVGPDGPWTRTFRGADYGSVEGTTAPDGEGVDVYDGGDRRAKYAFPIMQLRKDGEVDEWKIMLGFADIVSALNTYSAHVPPWAFGSVCIVHVDDLPHWIDKHGSLDDPNMGGPPSDGTTEQLDGSAEPSPVG